MHPRLRVLELDVILSALDTHDARRVAVLPIEYVRADRERLDVMEVKHQRTPIKFSMVFFQFDAINRTIAVVLHGRNRDFLSAETTDVLDEERDAVDIEHFLVPVEFFL